MIIRDILGGPPTATLAVFSQASYRATAVPVQKSGTLQWTIAGGDPGAAIQGPDDAEQVTVTTTHRSAMAGDLQLVATFTPDDGSQATVARVPLTVFAAEIRDAGNRPVPTFDIGIGNLVQYKPVIVPALSGVSASCYWQVGSNGRLAITSQAPTGEVDVLGNTVSLQGRDGTLTLTVQIGQQKATATLGLGIFDVQIAVDRYTPRAGVGEVVVCSANVVPTDTIAPGVSVSADWTVSQAFQILGDPSGVRISIVANQPSGRIDDDWVQVDLRWQGSTVRRRMALTAVGVTIRGEQGGEPPVTLNLGASAVFRAVVQPPVEGVRAFWATGPSAVVEQGELAARVTGVRPSAFEGADGLVVRLRAGAATAEALIPLTVVQLTGRT